MSRRIFLTAIDTVYDGDRAVGMAITHQMERATPTDGSNNLQVDIVTAQSISYETSPALYPPVTNDVNFIGNSLWRVINQWELYRTYKIMNRITMTLLQFNSPRPFFAEDYVPTGGTTITDGFLIEFPLEMRNEDYLPPAQGGGWRSLWIGSTNLSCSYLDPTKQAITINQTYEAPPTEELEALHAFPPMKVYTEHQEDVFPWPTQLCIVWDKDKGHYVYEQYDFQRAYNGYYSVPRNNYYTWTPTPIPSGGEIGGPDPTIAADINRMPAWRRQARTDCRTFEKTIPKNNELPDMFDLFFTKEDDSNRPVLSFFPGNYSFRKPPRVHVWNETGAFPLRAQADMWDYVRIGTKTKLQEDTLKLCSTPQPVGKGRNGDFHWTYGAEKTSSMLDYGACIHFVDADYGWYSLADCPNPYLMINNKKYMLLEDKDEIAKAIINIFREIDGRDRLLDIRRSI